MAYLVIVLVKNSRILVKRDQFASLALSHTLFVVSVKVEGSNDDVMRGFHDSLRRFRYSPQAKSYVLNFSQNEFVPVPLRIHIL